MMSDSRLKSNTKRALKYIGKNPQTVAQFLAMLLFGAGGVFFAIKGAVLLSKVELELGEKAILMLGTSVGLTWLMWHVPGPTDSNNKKGEK